MIANEERHSSLKVKEPFIMINAPFDLIIAMREKGEALDDYRHLGRFLNEHLSLLATARDAPSSHHHN